MPRYLQATTGRSPIADRFAISRGTRRHAGVVTCTIRDGSFTGAFTGVSTGIGAGIGAGIGECVPYPRYGESIECVIADIEAMAAGSGPA